MNRGKSGNKRRHKRQSRSESKGQSSRVAAWNCFITCEGTCKAFTVTNRGVPSSIASHGRGRLGRASHTIRRLKPIDRNEEEDDSRAVSFSLTSRGLSIPHKSKRRREQSQRDCVLQPRVASLRATLGPSRSDEPTPRGLCHKIGRPGHNLVGVVAEFVTASQPR